MKRTLSIVLALVMLLAMFTMVGAAESPEAQQAEAAETELTGETAPAPEAVSAPAPEVPAEPEASETEVSEPETAAEPAAAPAAEPAPTKPADTTDDYRYGVWLHVVNGGFTGSYSGAASVWVEFMDGTRQLPEALPAAARSNGVFDGWYTKAPTEVKRSFEDGKYEAWSTVTKNGTKIGGTTPVPEGVQVLYAAFNDMAQPDESAKFITFYLHANGMNGKNGALEVTRRYAEGGVKFTAKDAAVYGVNLNSDHTEELAGSTDQEQWKALKEIWAKEPVNGYTFLGWYTAEGELVDGEEETPTVKNGEHLYAHWQKGSEGQDTPLPTPTPAGPIDGMHIDARHLTIRQDPVKGGSVTIPLFVTPVGGTGEITWIVEVPPTFDPNHLDTAFKGKTQKYNVNDKGEITKDEETGTTEDPKFTAKVDGLNLVITPEKGCSQVLYVSAKSSTGKETPQPATVVITHTPNSAETVTQAATCTAAGEAAILCTECGEATEVHAIPATGHSYEVVGSQVVGGVRVYTEKCSAGDAEKQIKAGDANDDGYVSLRDVSMLYNSVKGSPNAEVTKEAGDTDGDGCVSMTDVNRLFNYVRGAASTLG